MSEHHLQERLQGTRVTIVGVPEPVGALPRQGQRTGGPLEEHNRSRLDHPSQVAWIEDGGTAAE
jgi:hypothetical protein